MGRLRFEDLESSYNNWTPIKLSGRNNHNKQLVLCVCACGTERDVRLDHLRSGASTNCGCLRCNDLTGQKFGMLEVVKSLGVFNHQQHLLCKCECGGEKEVKYDNLVRGNTKSCGCLNSEANAVIAEWLSEHGYVFEPEFTDHRCRNQKVLPFDFAVKSPDLKLVEFQGYHHYHPVSHRGGEERLRRTKEHDQIKRDFCHQNGIPLLAIPYWKRHSMFTLIEQFLMGANVPNG